MTGKNLSGWQDWNRQLPSIDLSALSESAGDVIDKLIMGASEGLSFHSNFSRCAFREALLIGANLDRVDFKDTSFIHSEFRDTALTDGSTVSCTFVDCTFIRCSFVGAAVHDSLYTRCNFFECDFEHSMFRNSSTFDSEFQRCRTSNKLFDGCRLYDNHFSDTWLDFSVVIDNFGLDSGQLSVDWVRSNRSSPQNVAFPFESMLRNSDWVNGLTPLNKAKLEYFLSNGRWEGGPNADAVFRLETWMTQVRAPVNLARLLQDFADFVFRRYRADVLDTIFVLELAKLARTIWSSLDDKPDYALLAQAATGAYLQCTHLLADLDDTLQSELDSRDTDQVFFRSYEDATDENIATLVNNITAVLPECQVQVLPRNSPVDIIFTHLSHSDVAFLVTLFFATKTKLQIARHTRREIGKKANEELLFSMAIGGAREKTTVEAFKIEQTFPGLINVRLDLRYSTSLAKSVKSVVQFWGR